MKSVEYAYSPYPHNINYKLLSPLQKSYYNNVDRKDWKDFANLYIDSGSSGSSNGGVGGGSSGYGSGNLGANVGVIGVGGVVYNNTIPPHTTNNVSTDIGDFHMITPTPAPPTTTPSITYPRPSHPTTTDANITVVNTKEKMTTLYPQIGSRTTR